MKASSLHLCALLLSVGAGCNAIAGINEPIDPPGSSGGTTSGGTTSGGTTSGIDRFVGHWIAPSATQTVQCGDGKPVSQSGSLELVLTKDTDTEIVITPADAPDCHIRCAVSENTATALPDQECTVALASETDTYKYSQPTTFTISDDGATAQVLFTASVYVDPPGASCDFTENSTYTKK